MRIDFKQLYVIVSNCTVLIMVLNVSVQPAQAQGLQITEGSISIRALAERQRRLEEAEFLNKLNPGSTAPQLPQFPLSMLNFPQQDGSAASATSVQSLPPLALEPLLPKEPDVPVNTVLSVYGPEGSVVAEVAQKGGNIARYEVGDSWAGYKIISISGEGVAIGKGGKTRLVSVGGRL